MDGAWFCWFSCCSVPVLDSLQSSLGNWDEALMGNYPVLWVRSLSAEQNQIFLNTLTNPSDCRYPIDLHCTSCKSYRFYRLRISYRFYRLQISSEFCTAHLANPADIPESKDCRYPIDSTNCLYPSDSTDCS